MKDILNKIETQISPLNLGRILYVSLFLVGFFLIIAALQRLVADQTACSSYRPVSQAPTKMCGF